MHFDSILMSNQSEGWAVIEHFRLFASLAGFNELMRWDESLGRSFQNDQPVRLKRLEVLRGARSTEIF